MRKFMALSVCIRKAERSEINKIRFHSKKLEKKSKLHPKQSKGRK